MTEKKIPPPPKETDIEVLKRKWEDDINYYCNVNVTASVV
jgi:hypothetical protein